MEIRIEKKEKTIEIFISINPSIWKTQERVVINRDKAREILLEKCPGLNISKLPKISRMIDSLDRSRLQATWIFDLEEEKENQKEQVQQKKEQKKTKPLLTFKPKTDIVVETTDAAPEQIKGVEEPTE